MGAEGFRVEAKRLLICGQDVWAPKCEKDFAFVGHIPQRNAKTLDPCLRRVLTETGERKTQRLIYTDTESERGHGKSLY